MAANSAAAVGRELLSDWSAEELEAVLYALEVEEAIPKVRASESAYEYVSTMSYMYKCIASILTGLCRYTRAQIHWTAKTLIPLTTSTNCFPQNR